MLNRSILFKFFDNDGEQVVSLVSLIKVSPSQRRKIISEKEEDSLDYKDLFSNKYTK
jgi:hypothetical protein